LCARLLKNRLPYEDLSALAVSLRTEQCGWLHRFIECQGLAALAKVLSDLNSHYGLPIKIEDLDREQEIIKCMKTATRQNEGVQDVLRHNFILTAITSSLVSPRTLTRRITADILSWFCQQPSNKGHELVLSSMETVRQVKGDERIFDVWLWRIEKTFDEFNSNDPHDEISGPSLREYCIANMTLINALIERGLDSQLRMHIRSQLQASGLARVLNKLRTIDHENLRKLVQIYKSQ
jgi:cytokinesis protein